MRSWSKVFFKYQTFWIKSKSKFGIPMHFSCWQC